MSRRKQPAASLHGYVAWLVGYVLTLLGLTHIGFELDSLLDAIVVVVCGFIVGNVMQKVIDS